MAWVQAARSAFRVHSCLRHARSLHWTKVSPKSKNPLDKFKGAAYVGVAGVSVVAAVALLPPFKETRRGFQIAFSAKRPAVSEVWGYVLGPMGGFAAFMGSTANIVKIGADYPILAGLRTPLALSGGVIGCSMSFYLAPLIIDGARCLTHVVAFSIDGLVADVVGRPEGQLPAWDTSRMWGWDEAEKASPEARALDQRMRQSLYSSEVASSPAGEEAQDAAASAALEDEETQKEIRWMCSELLRLRTQERSLKILRREIARDDGARILLEQNRTEQREIEAKKKTLKDAARLRYDIALGKRTDGELISAVAKLQALRYKQLALADQVYHGLRAERRAIVDDQLRVLDQQKGRLKQEFRREFGVVLSHRTKKVQRWKDAAANGIKRKR